MENNTKYKKLDESQKQLLKNFINNVSNTNKMREFVDTEVQIVKEKLNRHLPKVKDKVTKIKLSEAIKQIVDQKINKQLDQSSNIYLNKIKKSIIINEL